MVARNGQIVGFDRETEQRILLKLSRGTAIVFLFSEFISPPKRHDPLTKLLHSSLCFVSLFPTLFPQEFVR